MPIWRRGSTRSRSGNRATAPRACSLSIGQGPPHQFRLLSDGLLGYAWPKWVRAGEKSEFRVHSAEAYKLTLWRYGWQKEFVRNLGWFDEHGPRATVQITPDGDYTQTRRAVEQVRLHQPAPQAVRRGAGAERAVLLSRQERSGRVLLVSVDRGARQAASGDGRAVGQHHLERLQQLRRAEQLHPSGPLSADADGQRPPGAEALHRPGARQLRHGRLRPALVRPARADQSCAGARAGHRSDRGAGRLPRRAGRVAAAGLAGARGLRVRLLRRNATSLRRAGPGSLPRAA